MLQTILIASHNPAKVQRYGRLLTSFAHQVIGLREAGIASKPREHGETAEENAAIKARFYADLSGLPAFSEDESLFVDFLPPHRQPGVHVRRINGQEDASDDQMLAYWETILPFVPESQRTGCWHVACCLALPGGVLHTIAVDYPARFFSPSSPARIPGWPMSSLQGPAGFGRPLSELSAEERRLSDLHADEIILARMQQFSTRDEISK